jgi:molecular chaperone HscB
MNYFELFGFEEKPFVDRSLVSKKYFELQKKFHPDFFTNESEDDKKMHWSNLLM